MIPTVNSLKVPYFKSTFKEDFKLYGGDGHFITVILDKSSESIVLMDHLNPSLYEHYAHDILRNLYWILFGADKTATIYVPDLVPQGKAQMTIIR